MPKHRRPVTVEMLGEFRRLRPSSSNERESMRSCLGGVSVWSFIAWQRYAPHSGLVAVDPVSFQEIASRKAMERSSSAAVGLQGIMTFPVLVPSIDNPLATVGLVGHGNIFTIDLNLAPGHRVFKDERLV
jgi:hypothetical protein